MNKDDVLINRREHFSVYVDKLEKKAITLAAQEAGISVSEYIRLAALSPNKYAQMTEKSIPMCILLAEYREGIARIQRLLEERGDFMEQLKKEIMQQSEATQNFV